MKNCLNPLETDVSTDYTESQLVFDEGQENLFLKFQANETSILFMVFGEGIWPEEIRLYSESCQDEPLISQILHIDSNDFRSLSLVYHDLVPETNYIIQIERELPSGFGTDGEAILV